MQDERQESDIPRSIEIEVYPESRLAVARFAPGTILKVNHGLAIIDALTNLVGTNSDPFGLLADTLGVRATDAEYRAITGVFFRKHRKTAHVAVLNMSPVIRVVAELFRVAIGLQIKGFPDEHSARAWLRTKGIAA